MMIHANDLLRLVKHLKLSATYASKPFEMSHFLFQVYDVSIERPHERNFNRGVAGHLAGEHYALAHGDVHRGGRDSNYGPL